MFRADCQMFDAFVTLVTHSQVKPFGEASGLSESQSDRERVVVGSRDRAIDLGLARANVSPRKDPIDYPPLLEERVRCCWHVLTCKCVLKLRAGHRGSGRPPGQIEIKIASEYYRYVLVVLPGIVQSLVKLRTAQPIVTPAFQVQVISNDRSPCDIGIADQCQASPDSLLKRLDSRKEPVWVPKIRLLLES